MPCLKCIQFIELVTPNSLSIEASDGIRWEHILWSFDLKCLLKFQYKVLTKVPIWSRLSFKLKYTSISSSKFQSDLKHNYSFEMKSRSEVLIQFQIDALKLIIEVSKWRHESKIRKQVSKLRSMYQFKVSMQA